MPGFFDDAGATIKDIGQGIGNQAQATGRDFGNWLSDSWQEPSTKRGIGMLALAPLAMLLASSLNKRRNRQAAAGQTLGYLGNLAYNQFMQPSREKDAYTQAAINRGEFEPIKPGEQPGPGDLRFGGMTFRKVPKLGEMAPELTQDPSQFSKQGPWAAGPDQAPAPLSPTSLMIRHFLAGMPGTPTNQATAINALAAEGKGDLATKLATMRLNTPDFQYVPGTNGEIYGLDKHKIQAPFATGITKPPQVNHAAITLPTHPGEVKMLDPTVRLDDIPETTRNDSHFSFTQGNDGRVSVKNMDEPDLNRTDQIFAKDFRTARDEVVNAARAMNLQVKVMDQAIAKAQTGIVDVSSIAETVKMVNNASGKIQGVMGRIPGNEMNLFAQAAGGWADQAGQIFQKIQSGKYLPQDAVADLHMLREEIASQAQQRALAVIRDLRQRAIDGKMSPRGMKLAGIYTDPDFGEGTSTGPPPAPGSAPPSTTPGVDNGWVSPTGQ